MIATRSPSLAQKRARVPSGKAQGWACLLCVVCCCLKTAGAADFKAELFGEPSRIFANIVTQNVNTGYVQINGVALGLASQPVWDFGDGTVAGSWFPAPHTYVPPRSNYIVRVTGRFTDGATNSAEVLVRFTPPSLAPVALPVELSVTIPTSDVALISRMPGYGFSPSLTHFDEGSFSPNLPRAAVEYVLTVAASIQNELVNSNVYWIESGFRQCVLRDPSFGGMYSIWYSSPVAFGSGDYGFQGAPQYSSFFHEMGHNFTLNFPAAYYYGGKIDGQANAIYSETLAQIFQHATAYEIMNRGAECGLPADLVFDIRQSARGSLGVLRGGYEDYLASGTNFCSWNNPVTGPDETFDTFMTIAYKFLAHAEIAGQGYRVPVQRLSRLLAVFNQGLRQQYDQDRNTPAADAFRATLLVAALSYAFQSDLRAEFRELRFPLSDAIYDQLLSLATPGAPALFIARMSTNSVSVSWPSPSTDWNLQVNTNSVSSLNWSNVTATIQDDGKTKTLIVNPAHGPRFYRLHKP